MSIFAFFTAKSSPQAQASTRSMNNNTRSAWQALQDQVRALGEDAALLDELPYEKAFIQKAARPQVSLQNAVQKKLLSDRILIGTIEDEDDTMSLLWAHLLDNNVDNGNPELIYYSQRHSVKKGTRHAAREAQISGSLRPEFSHCDSPSMLTATARFYLYKHGVKTWCPITVRNNLARDIIGSCKKSESDKINADFPANQTEDSSQPDVDMDDTPGEQENKDIKLEDYTDPGFVTPQPSPCAKLSGSSSKRSSRTSSSNAHPHTPVHNSIDVNNSSPIARLRAIQEKEREITVTLQKVQAEVESNAGNLANMEIKRSRLQSELMKLEQAIEATQSHNTLTTQYEKDLFTAIQEFKDERKNIIERMDPELRSALEMGRQLERGFK